MAAALVLFFLLFYAAHSAPHKNSKIPVSSVLTPRTANSSVWLSPSGMFAMGFYNTPNGYAICIFLAGITEKTVVWTANNFDPILPNNVISLSISSQGLKLWRHLDYGNRLLRVYDTIASPSQSTAWASMLDNGNFVLYNSHGRPIWQSFDYPTNTLLPGQRLPAPGELFSRASERDLAMGMFRLKMKTNGNLVQYPVTTPDTSENAYYASNNDGYAAGSNMSLNLDSDGRLYLFDGNSQYSYNITSGWKGKHSMYLARVDPDGIFRVYNRGLDDWKAVWSSTEDKCAPKGICGVNSFCSYEYGFVNCTCLPGFGEAAAGCRPHFYFDEACALENFHVRYEMQTVRNVTWIDNYYAVDDAVGLGEEDCARLCLDDCRCIVALFEKGGLCRKQRLPLRYGVRSTSTVSRMALVRVVLPDPDPPQPSSPPVEAPDGSVPGIGSRKRLSNPREYAIIGAALLIPSIIIIYLTKRSLFSNQDKESKQNTNKLLLSHGSLAPKRYSYKEIKKITKSYAEKLGQGGYGIVYKGWLPDGQLVAVKVLKETHDNAEEFINEVASISKTSHVNIVNLLGFCFGRKKRALVYEFMPNKSLDKFIYKSGSMDAECLFEWPKLYRIAVGVARGLEYLHRGCNTRIIHFDIKPQNILLDEDFCPKISDFGLAKLCMMKQSVVSMLGTRGTIGYIAPEVFSRIFGVVSHKSDVYSYGIMLLLMVEARTNVEVKSFKSSEETYFYEKIYEHVLVSNEKVYAVMTEDEEEDVRKMLMVGFWCIQTAPSDRPSMNNVVDMLQGNVESIEIPPLPFLLSSPKPQFSCLLPLIVETQSSSDDIL